MEKAQPKAEHFVLEWIRTRKKESKRIEFKACVDIIAPERKAEFIRDVISLANSEGEQPRDPGYLVIGCKDGRTFDVTSSHFDGANFRQIVEAYVSPELTMEYEEIDTPENTRIGILAIKADPEKLYVVRKRLSNRGKSLLEAGQSWGRAVAGKVPLDGDAISERIRQISETKVERAVEPLRGRIEALEEHGGPALDVRRIRFEIEAERDWGKLDQLVGRLFPYAREFDEKVKDQVLDATYEVTSRTRNGMTWDVAEGLSSVLMELMPIGLGGLHYASRTPIANKDQILLERIEDQAFNISYDACRYLRDTQVAEVGAHLYYALIRFAALNGLQRLKAKFLHNAERCIAHCKEIRQGQDFPEGEKLFRGQVEVALDLES